MLKKLSKIGGRAIGDRINEDNNRSLQYQNKDTSFDEILDSMNYNSTPSVDSHSNINTSTDKSFKSVNKSNSPSVDYLPKIYSSFEGIIVRLNIKKVIISRKGITYILYYGKFLSYQMALDWISILIWKE